MVISTFNVAMLDISMRCDFNIQCDDVGNFNATISTFQCSNTGCSYDDNFEHCQCSCALLTFLDY